MDLLVVTLGAVVALGFGLIPFLFFNREMNQAAGTSTVTNAMLYRKLLNEEKLTRLQIRALRQQQSREQIREARETRERWQKSHETFCRDLERGWH
jgi:hypothetical protein